MHCLWPLMLSISLPSTIASIGSYPTADVRSSVRFSTSLEEATQPGSFSRFLAASPVTNIINLITTTAKIVDIVLRFTGTTESPELTEIKNLQNQVKERFDRVDLDLQNINRQLNWTAVLNPFVSVEKHINSNFYRLQEIYNSSLNLKDVRKQIFLDEFPRSCTDCAIDLFQGIVSTNLIFSHNLWKSAQTSLNYDRHKMQSFMIGTLQLLIKAITSELIYKNIKYGEVLYLSERAKWIERLKSVAARMDVIDDEVKSKWYDQASHDIDEASIKHLSLSRPNFSKTLYDLLTTKYYWRDWLVIVYKPIWGVRNHINHICDGYKKYGPHNRNIAVASVEKTKPKLSMKAARFVCNIQTKTYYTSFCGYSYGGCSQNNLNAEQVYSSIPADTRSCSTYASVGVIDSWVDLWYQAPDDRLIQFRTPGDNSYSIHLFG